MSKKAIFCMTLISFLLLASIPVNADSSSLFRYAGTVQPVQNNNVRMVEEKVDIQAYGGWSVVRCEFVFKNESRKAQDILMGFPASLIGEGNEIDGTTRLRDFKIYDNGVEKKANLEESGKDSIEKDRIAEWYTWDIRFQAGEERKIINTYKAQNYNAPWARYSGYILKTGAPWKGTIGKAIITFELMDIASSNIDAEYTHPKGYRVDKNKVIWEMRDFEPTEDISLALSSYWSIFNILPGWDEDEKEVIWKQLEQVKMLFINESKEEGLHQANLLLQKGIYSEELYFCILDYYHKQNNIDEFIRILKEQIQHLNSPHVMEWAKVLYPERINAEGLTYPDNHKPVIQNQAIRKLNETQFELSADLHDVAGDMTFFSSTAYANGLTMNSLLEEKDNNIIFGLKSYDYKAKGKLPEPYSDLVWRLEVSDYKGDTHFGMTLDDNRLGESCYFYDGSTFEPWNVKKDGFFTLCYYDKNFDSMEGELRKALSDRFYSIIKNLGIKIPEGGYTINLYEKSHMDGLKKDSPQNITLYLKSSEYRAKIHNDSAAGKSEEESKKWDWGDIIAELDSNNIEKMVESILQQVIKHRFGEKWKSVKPEIASSFIAASVGEPDKGRYYEAFSSMTKDELKKAAQDIGITGRTGKYVSSNGKWIILVFALALAGGFILRYKNWQKNSYIRKE